MTPEAAAKHPREDLFIADFYPEFGAYLARRLAGGYDATAEAARFAAWLAARADDGGALADYLAMAEGFPPLTAEQEAELAARVRAGYQAEERLAGGGERLAEEMRADLERAAETGTTAGNRLIEANLRTVTAMAAQFAAHGVPVQDLIKEGARGLVRALQRYDPARGHRFTTYSAWWVRQAMTRAVSERGRAALFPEPGAGDDELTRVERRLSQSLGREPTAEELAAELDLPLLPLETIPGNRPRSLIAAHITRTRRRQLRAGIRSARSAGSPAGR